MPHFVSTIKIKEGEISRNPFDNPSGTCSSQGRSQQPLPDTEVDTPIVTGYYQCNV
jgi:hypothetical protein